MRFISKVNRIFYFNKMLVFYHLNNSVGQEWFILQLRLIFLYLMNVSVIGIVHESQVKCIEMSATEHQVWDL